MVTGPERRGQSHGERRRSTEQIIYKARTGRGVTSLRCSVSSDTVSWLRAQEVSWLRQAGADQAQARANSQAWF